MFKIKIDGLVEEIEKLTENIECRLAVRGAGLLRVARVACMRDGTMVEELRLGDTQVLPVCPPDPHLSACSG